MSTKITDLVDPSVFDELKKLKEEMASAVEAYKNAALELAKGLTIKVTCMGDIDKIEKIMAASQREAAAAAERMNNVMERQNAIIHDTTNTIARELMERERRNKLVREEYRDGEKVRSMVEGISSSYEGMTIEMAKVTNSIKSTRKEMSDLEKRYKAGGMSYDEYIEKQAKLIAKDRELSLAKSQLGELMKIEEKLNSDNAGSYNQLSHQLELLKKQYKDMPDTMRESDIGKEFERVIQDLDAHLKDMAADMGEFQRNVGNYAIAGQNGIVATESVTAAIEQEARTTQDLIDQTKILEESKNLLNKDDENYQATLDAVNAKLDENKRKLMDVSDIIDKEATSIAEAEAQNKRFHEALKHVDLTSDEAQETIENLNRRIAENTRLIRENTPAIEDQTAATEDRTEANQSAADELLDLVGLNNNFGDSLRGLSETNAAGVMDGLGTKIKALGKTVLGLVSNPWVLAFLGIAGIAAGFKWWYDYNKGLVEATKLTKDFTGLTGDTLKGVRNEVQAVADAYDKDFREVLEAANAMSKQFGISFQESIKLIEDGFVAGADANGEFIENIKEYPAYFHEAGLSASEFIAITTQANKAGIYSDKGIDVIKEGNLRIREMTKATAEALDAIGISSKQVQKDLADNSKTTFDIMQEVSEKLAEFPESSSEVGTALADIFGGPGEDAGLQYILTLKDIDKNLDNVKGRAGELAKLEEEQLRSQVELENIISSVFDATGGSFESMTTKAKTFVNKGIIAIIKGCVDIVNWFIRLYNKSIAVRGAFNGIVNAFKILWEVAKFVAGQVIDQFKALGTMIEGVFTLDWEKVQQGWLDGVKSLKGGVKTMIQDIASNTAEAWNKTLNDEMQEVTLNTSTISQTTEVTDTRNKPKPPYNPKETDEEKKAREKAAKDAEKAAKEELKRIYELEEAKLAVMTEGHEKELATIRLKYRKKIDEIKGEGETEKALRLQLAEQCEKEVADCSARYRQELAKINLANRLAAAKEGSKEELDLKLAQLEAERLAEIKEAEKTGADVLLIEAKYAKEREKLDEEYSASVISQIEERYSAAQEKRDTDHVLEMASIKERYKKQLEEAGNNAGKLERIQDQYARDAAERERQYAEETARASIALLQETLASEDLSAKDRLEIERKLARAKNDLEDMIADHAIEKIEEVAEADRTASDRRRENAERWLSAAADSLNAVNDLAQTIYDAQIERLENQQEANTEAGEAEQERISELVEKKVITEEEGEARKRAAEALTARKNEEIEKKKAKLKRNQAIWDKANSIAQIGINTALSIMQTQAQLGYPAAIPFIALAAAMGALQLATVMATPIPQYKKGTDYHKGGLAIVGDGGVSELVTYAGKSWVTPDVPTLVDLPVGATVFPELVKTMPLFIDPMPITDEPNVIVNNDYSRLERGLRYVAGLIREQTRQQMKIAYDAEYERYKNSKI